MDENDFYCLLAAIALLAIGGIMQARIMKQQSDMLIRHDEDITFLRLVARETEKRLADD